MLFLVALIPATALTVGGYVALFLSNRSEGSLKTFGHYLGIWAFVLAGLVVVGGGFAAGHMHRMHETMWAGHGGSDGPGCPWMEHRERMEPGPPPGKGAPPEAPAPAAPAPASK